MKVIEVQGLCKNYGRIKALSDLSFSLEENKITGLIGRNGAGKTTLLKIVAGFLKSTSGQVRVLGDNPFNSLKVSANMIFIDDNMVFPATLNLSEILEAAAGFYANWDMNLARNLMDYFGFDPKLSHQHLSKGRKSTFNIIIGLAAHCVITIFDEPTTGMDAAVRKDFYKALLKDYIEHPHTVILSSHLVNEIDDILEDILLIKDGTNGIHLPVNELRELAIGLRGSSGAVNDLTKGKDLLYAESFGKDSLYKVVKNDFPEGILNSAKLAGVEILPIAVDDLCIYLTAGTKGGIEDVFNRD